mgnify:CR=1 FL=1
MMWGIGGRGLFLQILKTLTIMDNLNKEPRTLDSNGTDQITNFMFFAYNFPMRWIQEAFGEGTSLANHIDAKWQNLNKRNGHGGTANVFNLFMELSEGNRETLCKWVAENYSHKL